ncbi:MAG: UPF0280 family protein [Caulobacteraceae bacterium]|nr:UPF0280 family protein [Caulobacter sp.]
MTRRPQVNLLTDGHRLHLQDGPIDLICGASGHPGDIRAAYAAAAYALDGLLDRLCAELPALRHRAGPLAPPLRDPVARCMAAAVSPYAAETFITPMAAVAGAVAEAVLAAMDAAAHLDRVYVNNGGDIALRCGPGQHFAVGLIDRPDRPNLFGRVRVGNGDGIEGIATSGWRGRSFSRGIADSVTVLAGTAAEADAAATVIANAVDLPGHPAVHRARACGLQPDSDLGDRLVTRGVEALAPAEAAEALAAGRLRALDLLRHGLIVGAALQVQGHVALVGAPRVLEESGRAEPPAARAREVAIHA